MQMECQENTSLSRLPHAARSVIWWWSQHFQFCSGSWSGAAVAALIWVQPIWALPAALLSSVAISQTGLALSRCARARAQQGVGLMWQQAGWCGWLQAGQHQPRSLRCSAHTATPKRWRDVSSISSWSKMEQFSFLLTGLCKFVLEDSRAEWDIQGLLWGCWGICLALAVG